FSPCPPSLFCSSRPSVHDRYLLGNSFGATCARVECPTLMLGTPDGSTAGSSPPATPKGEGVGRSKANGWDGRGPQSDDPLRLSRVLLVRSAPCARPGTTSAFGPSP